MEKTFNCYTCKYQGEISGDAHSCCMYPGTKYGLFDFFEPKNIEIALQLHIRGNDHGIRSGWFMWPVNFDPVWLENCDGYVKRS